MKMHQELYGVARIPLVNLQWTTVALYILMDHLDTDETRAAFIDLCICARALSRRWTLAMGVLRMIQINASTRNIVLPDETIQLFEDFESQTWRSGDRKRFSSRYPDLVSVISNRNEQNADVVTEMDQLLEKWEGMELKFEKEKGKRTAKARERENDKDKDKDKTDSSGSDRSVTSIRTREKRHAARK